MKFLDREFEGDALEAWFDERPECIQKLVYLCPPGAMMVNKETGQLMSIFSWFEDGTVKVVVEGEYNIGCINFGVFGIDPTDLTFYCWADDEDKLGAWIKDHPEWF